MKKVRAKVKYPRREKEDDEGSEDYKIKSARVCATEIEISSEEDDEDDNEDDFVESIPDICKLISEIKPTPLNNIINLKIDNGIKQIDTSLILTLIKKYGIYGVLKINMSRSQFRKHPKMFYFYIATVITFLLVNQTREARNDFTKNSIKFLSQIKKDDIPLLLNSTIENVHLNSSLLTEILLSLLIDTEGHCCYKNSMFKNSRKITEILNLLSCLTKTQISCLNFNDDKNDASLKSNGGYKGEINMSFGNFDSKTEFTVNIYINKYQYSLGNYSIPPLDISKNISQQTLEEIFRTIPFENNDHNHYKDGYLGGDYDLRYLLQMSYDYEDYKIDKDRVLEELENSTNFGSGKTQKWEHINQYEAIVNKAKQYAASYDPTPPYIIAQSSPNAGIFAPVRSANPRTKM